MNLLLGCLWVSRCLLVMVSVALRLRQLLSQLVIFVRWNDRWITMRSLIIIDAMTLFLIWACTIHLLGCQGDPSLLRGICLYLVLLLCLRSYRCGCLIRTKRVCRLCNGKRSRMVNHHSSCLLSLFRLVLRDRLSNLATVVVSSTMSLRCILRSCDFLKFKTLSNLGLSKRHALD